MKTKFNRFAIIPFHCTSCHRYIWLEPYRRAEVYRPVAPCVPSFYKENWCKECTEKHLKEYDVPAADEERKE